MFSPQAIMEQQQQQQQRSPKKTASVFRLNNPSHNTTMLANCYSLYKANKFTDLTILCSDKTFECHRIMLAARSDYFGGTFGGQNKSAPVFILSNIHGHIFEILLEYMYTGSADVPEEDLAEVISSGRSLRIAGFEPWTADNHSGSTEPTASPSVDDSGNSSQEKSNPELLSDNDEAPLVIDKSAGDRTSSATAAAAATSTPPSLPISAANANISASSSSCPSPAMAAAAPASSSSVNPGQTNTASASASASAAMAHYYQLWLDNQNQNGGAVDPAAALYRAIMLRHLYSNQATNDDVPTDDREETQERTTSDTDIDVVGMQEGSPPQVDQSQPRGKRKRAHFIFAKDGKLLTIF